MATMNTDKEHDHSGGVCGNEGCALSNPDTAKLFWDAIKQGKADGMVKVSLPTSEDMSMGGETVWAHPLDSSTVVIRNIPAFTDCCGLNDIVEVSGNDFVRSYVRTVQRNTGVIYCKYRTEEDEDREELLKRTRPMFAAVEEVDGFHTEGMFAGFFVLAYDLDKFTDDEAADLIGILGDENNNDWGMEVAYDEEDDETLGIGGE